MRAIRVFWRWRGIRRMWLVWGFREMWDICILLHRMGRVKLCLPVGHVTAAKQSMLWDFGTCALEEEEVTCADRRSRRWGYCLFCLNRRLKKIMIFDICRGMEQISRIWVSPLWSPLWQNVWEIFSYCWCCFIPLSTNSELICFDSTTWRWTQWFLPGYIFLFLLFRHGHDCLTRSWCS